MIASRAVRGCAALGGLLLSFAGAAAQVEVQADLEGRVLLGEVPLEGVQVVLHRVSADSAGELDSLRTAADGSFRFRLPALPDPGDGGRVYFASVRHEGILYFGSALSRPVQLDSLYTIQAWDTLAAPAEGAPLPVAVRYLVFESIPEGWQVTDLFELEVAAGGTWVAREGGFTWRHPLPAGARDVDGELAGAQDDASRPTIEDGHVVVRAPLSPGPRQFVLRYQVAALDGLEIPFATPVGAVELLVQEPVPDLTVSGLEAVETVEMEPGVEYRHYAGAFEASTVVAIEVADPPFRLPLEWTAVVLALLLAGAGVYAVRRGAGADRPAASMAAAPPGDDPQTPRPADAGALRQARLLEIARLDEQLDDDTLEDRARERLRARRAELVARLRAGA